MANSSDSLRRLVPATSNRLRGQTGRTTKSLRFLAVGLGATAALLSLAAGVYSYRVSYQMQLNGMLRTNVAMAQSLADQAALEPRENVESHPLDLFLDNWAKMPRDDPAMFACVIARDGTLVLNSHQPDSVGMNVSGVAIPATTSRGAISIEDLLATHTDWAGINRSVSGAQQLVAFKYSDAFDGLIVIHTPEASYAAKVHQTTFPWLIGFGASTLLMWPLGLLLMNLAYDRARNRADAADRQRQASEQLFETIFEQAAIGVALIHTASGRFVRINGKYENLIGFTNDEIKSKTWQEITHPADLQPDLERMDLLRRGQLSEFDLQKRLICADGKMMWVNLTVSATCHLGEIGVYHIAVIEDITERRQAALALAESEHRFRTLVEHAPEAIVVFDVDQQRFVDFNENALRMFGATRAEMLTLTPELLSPPFQPDGRSSAAGAQELIVRALAGATPIQEWIHIDRQGNEICSEIRLVRLFATGHRLVRGSITDISERKRTEEKLRQQQAELAHVSRLSVMGEMVAGIAHEINQPLFAISNYAHTCNRILNRENPNVPDVLEWCGDIEREATRAAEIIRRLRDFTRKGEQPHSIVNVNEAVRETIALLMLDSRQHQVAIRSRLTGESVMIQGDPIGLQQVLVNLILNACESLAASGVERRLVNLNTEQCGPFVQITIVDNGPGFSNADLDKVFDTFYSNKTDGMGMGLAISRTLVEAHGGTLTASNGENGGAMLQITLPRLAGARLQEVAASHA